MRAGIYTRLSLDRDGESTATARQRADCEAFAAGRGMEVVEVYEDNDVSAFDKRKRRPGFERLLADLRLGVIDTVLVWKLDRFVRQPRDLERFVDIAEEEKSNLVSVIEGEQPLVVLRIMAALAHQSSADTSVRVARAHREAAEAGRPHAGPRKFGYTPDMQPHPVEAPLVVEAAERVLAGESVRSIARDYEARGVTAANGGKLASQTLRRTLMAPHQAGLRTYRGQLLPGSWPANIDRERWERIVSLFEHRSVETFRPRSVTRHLLTGLAVCGVCGATLGAARTQGIDKYRCTTTRGGHHCVSITAARLEGIVVQKVLEVADTPGYAELVTGRGSEDVQALAAQLREDQAALDQLVKDHYVERSIPRPAFLAAKDQLDARIEQARASLARQTSPLAEVVSGGELRRQWEQRGVTWQRAILDACVRRVVVNRSSNPHQWLDRIDVDWLA